MPLNCQIAWKKIHSATFHRHSPVSVESPDSTDTFLSSPDACRDIWASAQYVYFGKKLWFSDKNGGNPSGMTSPPLKWMG